MSPAPTRPAFEPTRPAYDPDRDEDPSVFDRSRASWLAVALSFAVAPALLDPHAVAATAALLPRVDTGDAYFVPAHGLLLYLRAPIVLLSATVLFLAPGLLLAAALGAATGAGRWILTGLATSLVVVSSVTALAQAITGTPLEGRGFAALVVALAVGAFLYLRWAIGRSAVLAWPVAERSDRDTIVGALTFPFLVVLVLAPKFHWESFNGDGAHAFEATRLLSVQAFPFWASSYGDVASFPGVTSMLFAYPASWFMRLFGELEASVRAPYLLAVLGLFAGIVALVRHGCRRSPTTSELALILLALGVFTLTLGFSATYNPYSADIALPAAQDTLLMACFTGLVLAFARGDPGWMALFATLTYTSLPAGGLLMAMWGLAVLAVWRPVPRRRLAALAISLVALGAVTALAPGLLEAWGHPIPGGEYAASGILGRFALLQIEDWWRLRFLLFPCGLVPVLALVDWRAQGRLARALTAVTAAYFLFFYVQAHVVLHHFVPTMVLPLVVLWRNRRLDRPETRRLVVPVAAAGAALCLFLSLPERAAPHITGREIGSTIRDRIGGYEELDPAAFRRARLLDRLFAYDWNPRVPREAYGGSPLVWYHYAHRPRLPRSRVNYVLDSSGVRPPPGASLVAASEGAALYVLDARRWREHRAQQLPSPAGSPLYAIDRGIVFRGLPVTDGPRIIDVAAVLERHGIDVEALLERLRLSD